VRMRNMIRARRGVHTGGSIGARTSISVTKPPAVAE
jgi:predicted TIM-barrel enzyme